MPFIENLSVKEFYGVGKKTAERMNQLGIYLGRDLQKWSYNGLIKHFGKAGDFFYSICRGVDDRSVVPNRTRKSIGIENTFANDLKTSEECSGEVQKLIDGLWKRMLSNNKFGRTITLKIKYNDFRQQTHSKTILQPINDKAELFGLTQELMNNVDFKKPVRLIGLSISNLEEKDKNTPLQLTINFE